MIAAGTHRDARVPPESLAAAADPAVDPRGRVELAGYAFRAEVERQFARYLENAWQPWAEAERRRRRLARLYVQLFTLHQELSGAITEAQVELVWGVGLGVWQHEATTVAYPLITRLVDLSFNPRNGAAEVRPRDLDPRLELDFYAAVDRPGVAQAEKLAREYLARAATTLSPFEPDTYEPLLEIAKRCLDSAGEVEPGAILFGDLAAAQPDAQLKVSRSWVLFARPRSSNVLVQDLEKLGKAVRELGDAPLPEAVCRTGERARRAERCRSSCRRSAVFPPEQQARSTCASPSRSTTSRCAWCSCSRPTRAWWCRGRRGPARPTPSPTSSATGWPTAGACW